MNRMIKTSLAAVVWFALGWSAAYCQQPQMIKIANGQTAEIWSGVNVTGKVHLRVLTRDGKNSIGLWWITWGVGSTTQIGTWGPNGSLNIPIAWWKGVVSAKLRGRATSDTVVYVSDRVEIDKTLTFHW